MRFLICSFVLAFTCVTALSGCSTPENEEDLVDLCPAGPNDVGAAGFRDEAHVRQFLAENKVELVNEIPLPLLVNFAWELRKYPESVRAHLARLDAKYRILVGRGVGEDPKWGGSMLSSDGRNYSRVSGAAAYTSWVVVNRMNEPGHGVSVVLHERAHTLDIWGVPGRTSTAGWGRLSSDPEWQSIIATDTVYQDVISRSCKTYCTQSPVEAFAETFAMYLGCEKSRALVSRSPRVVKFFESIIDATK
ncbi:hypothetical protein BH10BDE1_BH10BDE1_04210 [soil metagenome]